jgi:hypothetical protein
MLESDLKGLSSVSECWVRGLQLVHDSLAIVIESLVKTPTQLLVQISHILREVLPLFPGSKNTSHKRLGLINI